ncbi:MAG TPA: sigma-70 family RNA polymerase sigma factor, partial [Polyangiaceae bacterium]|nr:sigma-70 family RNA polymerase sigma factor [Polyangiaceae bacterium]
MAVAISLHTGAILSQRALSQRAGVFREGIVAHLPGLRAHARRLCDDRERAEDLVQGTVERALRFESSFREGSNQRAWLHQVLVSIFLGDCRKVQRNVRALARFSADPCSWVHDRHEPQPWARSARIQAALNEIPESYAEIVRSIDVLGQGYREASQEAGIPIGTVMSRLFRGRKMLRLALSDA